MSDEWCGDGKTICDLGFTQFPCGQVGPKNFRQEGMMCVKILSFSVWSPKNKHQCVWSENVIRFVENCFFKKFSQGNIFVPSRTRWNALERIIAFSKNGSWTVETTVATDLTKVSWAMIFEIVILSFFEKSPTLLFNQKLFHLKNKSSSRKKFGFFRSL